MQRKYAILLAIIVAISGPTASVDGAAFASDNSSIQLTDVDLGMALTMFYTAFQKIMPCGYPPMNLPILAPLTMGFVPINMTNEYYSVTGNVSNMIVTGLSDFRFIAFSYDDQTNRTSYDIIVPEVQLLAEYVVNAWALVAGFPTTMAGQGLLNVKLVDFRVVGDFAMGTSELSPNGLRISDFNLNFYVGDLVVNNWNRLWDIAANNFANRWARDFTLMWVEQIQVQVDEIYSQLVLPIANGLLANVTMDQLIDILVDESMEWNMANCTLT